MRAAMIHHRTRAAIRGQGFTIVELLVTMAVVAILIGLLVPGMGMIRRASLETRCLANLRTMATALHSYFNTSNEQYPISSHTTGDVSRADAWMQALAAHGFDGAVRICPADPYGEERVTSYAINTYFEPLVPGIDFDPFTQQILLVGAAARSRDCRKSQHRIEPSGPWKLKVLDSSTMFIQWVGRVWIKSRQPSRCSGTATVAMSSLQMGMPLA